MAHDRRLLNEERIETLRRTLPEWITQLKRPPAVGEDTTDILSAMLGMSDREIAALYSEGAIHRTEPFTYPQAEAVHP